MELSALTLQQLRYIAAVERHRSFGEAARACHVSQPGLSAQIKKVEEILDVVIFDRTRHPIVATDMGTRVLAHAKVVIDQVDQLSALVRGRRELAGNYRLGIIPSLVPSLVPLFLPRFTAAHPLVEIEIVESKTDDLVRKLREGTFDAGIAALPLDLPGFTERIIFHESFLVYVSPGHPLASRERIRQSDLVEEEVWLLREGHCFRSQALHLCGVEGRRPRSHVRFEADSFDTLIRLVDAELGITILPELVARALPSLRRTAQLRPFAAPEPVREVGLLTCRDVLRKSTSDAVVTTLQGALPKDIRGRSRRARDVLKPS